MSKRWKVGIVGYGWAAGAHIAALQRLRGVDVAAVCSSHVDAASVKREHGRSIDVVRSIDELLQRDDIAVIDICSRSNLHAEQAIKAARAGKHLIIEKPIALALEDLRALSSAVADARVHTCVCFELRFSPQLTTTKSLLDQGLLGDLHYAEIDYYDGVGPAFAQYEWNRLRDGGGSSLLSAGCHAMDALLMLMGGEVSEVTGYTTQSSHPTFARYEYPTTSLTVLRFADGRLAKVASVLDAQQPYYFRVHLFGSEGTVLDEKFSTRRIEGLDPARWSLLGTKIESSADVVEHPYLAQFEEFFAALDEDREMRLTSMSDVVPTFEAIFAADRSAELGRPLRIADLG